jgi:nucleoid-associated protein YgaU
VEALAFSPRDGSEIDTIVIPVIFGRALIEPYHGFTQYAVKAGDSLSSIAERFYEDDSQWQRILDANLHQLTNPDRVFVGQVLRIPQ